MRIGKQTCLAWGTLAVDACSTQKARVQDSSSVIHLTSPSSSSAEFHMWRFEDPEAAASGLAGVVVARNERASFLDPS